MERHSRQAVGSFIAWAIALLLTFAVAIAVGRLAIGRLTVGLPEQIQLIVGLVGVPFGMVICFFVSIAVGTFIAAMAIGEFDSQAFAGSLFGQGGLSKPARVAGSIGRRLRAILC